GVLLASLIAVKSGLASMPEGTSLRQIVGIAVLCGIGFTMSLFVGGLAFPTAEVLLLAPKIGILAASVVAGGVGALLISSSGKRAQARKGGRYQPLTPGLRVDTMANPVHNCPPCLRFCSGRDWVRRQ